MTKFDAYINLIESSLKNEGVASFVKKMGSDVGRGIKKGLAASVNPFTYVKGAGKVLGVAGKAIPAIAAAPGQALGAVSKVMQQGDISPVTGAVSKGLQATGSAVQKAGEYGSKAWAGQPPQEAGTINYNIRDTQSLINKGKLRVDTQGKTLTSLKPGDQFNVVDRRSGRSEPYEVIGKTPTDVVVKSAREQKLKK